jgi:hypothetical protein
MFKRSINKISFPTIFISAFVAITIIQAIAATALFLTPLPAQAAGKDFSMNLAVPLPTLNGGNAHIKFTGDTGPIAAYIKAIYNFAVGAVGIVAAVVLMIGGLMWITAGGNASTVTEAKSMITAAITGLVLVLTSYLLLSQVNPALVNLSSDINGIPTPKVDQDGGTEIIAANAEAPNYKNCSAIVTSQSFPNVCTVNQRALTLGDTNGCDKSKDPKFDPKNEMVVCCCDNLDWNQWMYQAGIDKQTGDAAGSLHTLLNCMRKVLPNSVGIISSISDNNITAKGWDFCSATKYPGQCTSEGQTNPPCCYHMKNSCHYGGTTGQQKSFAVDIADDDQTNRALINQAATGCGGKIFPEDTHLHISTTECPQQ